MRLCAAAPAGLHRSVRVKTVLLLGLQLPPTASPDARLARPLQTRRCATGKPAAHRPTKSESVLAQ
jgi:hypothetical protein